MTKRVDKVNKLAREVLGEAIQGLKDPRVGFVTVTRVRVTPDLRLARVLVSVFGTDEERAETMAGLQSAKPYLRATLGNEVRMKYLPELEFELDTGPEEAQRLEELLLKIHSEEDQR